MQILNLIFATNLIDKFYVSIILLFKGKGRVNTLP